MEIVRWWTRKLGEIGRQDEFLLLMSAVTKGFWNSFLIFDFVFFGPGLAGLGLPHRLGVTRPEPRKGENGEGSVSWEITN